MRERILTLLEMNNQFYAGQSGHALSLAIGLATCHAGEPLESALQRADRAMYDDKARYYETTGIDRRA
jgi:PleD family two-component response regulator